MVTKNAQNLNFARPAVRLGPSVPIMVRHFFPTKLD